MASDPNRDNGVHDLKLFWWNFAVRGGLAIIFAVVLFLASIFLGVFFFDPVTLVYMSLLLGSFVLGNGLLLGVAAVFAFEHNLHIRWQMLCECCFAVLLGLFIGISLMMTAKSFALLAGLHAVGNGCFQMFLAAKLRQDGLNGLLLSCAAALSLVLGVVFLTHIHLGARTTTQLLSGFELFSGVMWLALAFRLRQPAIS